LKTTAWRIKKKKGGSHANRMQRHSKEWARLVAPSRDDDTELTPSDREEIAQLYNDPYAGRGLYKGMRTNNEYGYFNY